MLSWIIQISIISIILIFLVHHLIDFFKSTLTVPKIKDLVNSPKQKYNDIYGIITKDAKMNSNNNNNNNNNNYTLLDLLPTINENDKSNESDMKNELKHFLKNQLNPNVQTTNISSLDSISNNINFAPY
jgi:hypothetical protein